MALIDKLLADIVEDKVPLAQALSRTKVVAFRLKDEPLGKWINQELLGYEADSVLPSYRRLKCTVIGKQIGPFGSEQSLPVVISEPTIAERLNYARIVQSVSVLEESIAKAEGPYGFTPLPTEIVEILGQGMNIPHPWQLVEMHQRIQFSELGHIISITKQKLIDTLLILDVAFPKFDNGLSGTQADNARIFSEIQTLIFDSGSIAPH